MSTVQITILIPQTILIMAERVGMSRNNATFGKNILYFMSRYHIHISSNTIFATFIAVPNPKTINPSWRRLLSRNAWRVTQYIQLQSLYPIAHSCSFTLTFHSNTDIATPSPPLFTHSHTVMYYFNLLFAYPIYLIHQCKSNYQPILYKIRGLPNTYNYSHYISLRILVHSP